MNITLHRVFSIEECFALTSAILSSPQLLPENDVYYFNSLGVLNLAEAAPYIPRLELVINREFGKDICFANNYSRIYQNNSTLKIHADRPGLDITASVCLRKDTKEAWPLYISKKSWEGPWSNNVDHQPWLAEFNAYNLEVGEAVICEGRIYPHWRETLHCNNDEKNIYVFFHWSRLSSLTS